MSKEKSNGEMEIDKDTIPGLHGNIYDFLDREGQK